MRAWTCLLMGWLILLMTYLKALEPPIKPITNLEPKWSKSLNRDQALKVFKSQVANATARGYTAGNGLVTQGGAITDGGFVERTYKDTTIKLWKGPAPRIAPVDPVAPPEVPNLLIGVKVWADLSDVQGTKSGKFVNPEDHFWTPGERLYWWFEVTTPSHLAIIERHDVGTGLNPGKPGELASPNPNYPLIYTVIPPGTATRYPQLYKLNDDALPEFLTLLFLPPGTKLPTPNGGEQPLPLDNYPTNGNLDEAIKSQTEKLNEFGKTFDSNGGSAAAYAAAALARIEPTYPIGTDQPTFTSPKPDDVATILVGPKPFGFHTVRFYKAVIK